MCDVGVYGGYRDTCRHVLEKCAAQAEMVSLS